MAELVNAQAAGSWGADASRVETGGMLSDRRAARLAGSFFLVAMGASIAGGSVVDSIVETNADLATVDARSTLIVAGVLLEMVNCAAVVGIAAVLYPVLRRFGQASAIGYVAFRAIEAGLLAVAAVIPLALVGLSHDQDRIQAAATSSLGGLAPVLLSMREQFYGLGLVVFFCLGAALLYTVLYRSRLVPRFISVWGLVGVATVFVWNLLSVLGVEGGAIAAVLAAPIIANEVFLGVWLIAKGFDVRSAGAPPAGGARQPSGE
jgi:hypothetical protein